MAQWRPLANQNYIRGANNFSEGLDTSISPFFVKDSALIDGYGWDFGEYPALAVRKGRTAFGASGGAITRLLTNFGHTQLVRAVGSTLQFSSGGSWTNISGSFSNTDWDAANFDINGPALILTNGVDTPRYWNGSTLNTISQMPKGKYVAADNLRVYTSGTSPDDDTIAYCAFQNALDWTSPENSGVVQYYTANGGPVTALHAYNGQIWVFKKDSCAVIYHTGDARITHRLVPVSENIGCVSYKTVVEVGPYLFWLGASNVYIGAGDAAQEIGQPIRKFLDKINQAAVANACAFTDSQRYYLCIPTGTNTQPDTCLVYHYIYRKWLPYSISLGNIRFGTLFNDIAYVGNDTGQTFKWNDGTTDNGTPISWRVESRPFDDGVKEAEKELWEMHIQGLFPTGTTLSVEVAADDQGTTWYPINYDPTSAAAFTQNKNLIVPLDVVPICNFYRYRISGTGPATIQEIQRYSRIQPVQY